MWKYITILAVFNVGFGLTLLTSPARLGVMTVVAAASFIFVGLVCFFEVLYGSRSKNTKNRQLLRIIVQVFSFLTSFTWTLFIVILVLSARMSSVTLFSWVLILVGQALMIKTEDIQGVDELKKVIEEEKKGG